MKKKKEPKPYFFKRTGKLPTKAQLNEMREKVIALSQNNNGKKQSSDEVKPMTKKNEKKEVAKERAPKKSLTPDDISRLIEEWDNKTIGEWSKEFGVSYQTILKMAEAIRKEDETLCPPKPKKARTRTNLAKSGIALYRKKQGKK